MSVCYCANFYVLRSGTSLTPGRLPEDSLWSLSQAQTRDPQPENRADGI
ncbi:predicted protein [Chaetomium globosum CBS 148.51]|uniref:Uncharacterized protein n=1 Tax=Chaetomium globosum (strain ATCC 6205 / CBS 148.51 / DSM 1962 / NBRC 6347 / NRRL 1970) TaxID=306901 RepID=Q2H4I4_CHAGB|nr:uncharacterized protein CHGG_06431 [Chaetomium globosum CBS 148.51]EAQ89812.1 predicted protein [Chaetomium globosum CBS 148.51]